MSLVFPSLNFDFARSVPNYFTTAENYEIRGGNLQDLISTLDILNRIA